MYNYYFKCFFFKNNDKLMFFCGTDYLYILKKERKERFKQIGHFKFKGYMHNLQILRIAWRRYVFVIEEEVRLRRVRRIVMAKIGKGEERLKIYKTVYESANRSKDKIIKVQLMDKFHLFIAIWNGEWTNVFQFHLKKLKYVKMAQVQMSLKEAER